MHKVIFIAALALSVSLAACGNTNSSSKSGSTKSSESPKRVRIISKITSPSPKDSFTLGEDIPFKFNATSKYDSAHVFLNDRKCAVTLNGDSGIIEGRYNSKVGARKLAVELFANGESQSKSIVFKVLPKGEPKRDNITITNTLTHNKEAYTQGLEFSNGKLLESSGQYGISYLAELEFPSMKEIRRTNLDSELFAEGITVLDNKIYLLTWQEGVGLIYDRDTFKQTGQWNYTGEGWGLTTDGKLLYMSDGTEVIKIIDPSTMKEIDRIEAYTSKGALGYINELEWIDDRIWANIYSTDYIAVINPQSGEVERLIDCSPLSAKVGGAVDVLNGIAKEPNSGKIYLTGKLWPNTFEVRINKQ